MKPLNVFFSYFGGKWHLAKHYPAPIHDTIIEPFAGSASYSLHYPQKNVELYEIDPVIFGIWDYLLKATDEEIWKLPLEISNLANLGIPQEAKWLIGMWLKRAGTSPAGAASGWLSQNKWPKAFWGGHIRNRIGNQLKYIRHWKVYNRSYEVIENKNATWFVDPPYVSFGKRYTFSKIDYPKLGEWCKERSGQTIVCESSKADWLPFQPLKEIKSIANTITQEKVWLNL